MLYPPGRSTTPALHGAPYAAPCRHHAGTHASTRLAPGRHHAGIAPAPCPLHGSATPAPRWHDARHHVGATLAPMATARPGTTLALAAQDRTGQPAGSTPAPRRHDGGTLPAPLGVSLALAWRRVGTCAARGYSFVSGVASQVRQLRAWPPSPVAVRVGVPRRGGGVVCGSACLLCFHRRVYTCLRSSLAPLLAWLAVAAWLFLAGLVGAGRVVRCPLL